MTATGTVTVVQETVAAGDTATMATITVSPALSIISKNYTWFGKIVPDYNSEHESGV